MGGKSSNSSKQSDTTSTDNRAIQQQENSGVQILGEGNKVTVTDHGAMNAAMEIAQSAGDLGADAFKTSVDLANITAGTTEKTFDFAESIALESLTGMGQLSVDVVDKLAQSNLENTQAIAGMNSSQMKSNEEQIKAITELAKSTNTGGATEISKQQTKVIIIVSVSFLIIVGLFFTLGKSK